MRIALNALAVCFLLATTSYGQQSGDWYRIPDPLQSSGNSPQRVERLANSLKSRVAALSHNVQQQPVEDELAITRAGSLPYQTDAFGSQVPFSVSGIDAGLEFYDPDYPMVSSGHLPSANFNSTQRISPILANPDQFWNRKQRPVVAVRNQAMFGVDPEDVCDEWGGFNLCCGLKLRPGHLGLPWLPGPDPCECVECKLGHKKGHKKCHKCKSGACR